MEADPERAGARFTPGPGAREGREFGPVSRVDGNGGVDPQQLEVGILEQRRDRGRALALMPADLRIDDEAGLTEGLGRPGSGGGHDNVHVIQLQDGRSRRRRVQHGTREQRGQREGSRGWRQHQRLDTEVRTVSPSLRDDGYRRLENARSRAAKLPAACSKGLSGNTGAILAPMHPEGRRCSSLTYAGYAGSSRLGRRAPRHPRWRRYSLTGPSLPTAPVSRTIARRRRA